jgi:hypothetical protein
MRLNEDAITEKLNNLSQMTPNKFRHAFACGYNSYMEGKTSLFKFGNTYVGPGVGNFWHRHHDAQRIMEYTRGPQEKMSSNLKNELYKFLQADTGTDKKSLKFHVLKELFELNANDYNDDQAKELIISTRSILFFILNPEEKKTLSSAPQPMKTG